MATPLQIRAPRPYSAGDDFALWIRRFEAYARSVRIPDEKLPDALLALLDDAAFRAYDLLGMDEDVVRDFKQLTEALSKRFAPSTGQQELRFLLGQRQQEAGETLDDFADALIHLANQSYPTLEPKLRMELARDRFVAGVRSEHVQEALLKTPPETLDHARETAKRIEAAQAARKIMRPKRSDVLAVTTAETQDEGKLTVTESVDYVQQRVTAQRQDDSLMEVVHCNTEVLERLLGQMTLSGNSTQRPPPRQQAPTCWRCGQRGHVRQECTSLGNKQRLAPWVDRQPRAH